MNHSGKSSFEQSAGCVSPDVESLLEQVVLRAPSERLDFAIADLANAKRVDPSVDSSTAQFGWRTLVCSVAVALLVGLSLGCLFMNQSIAENSTVHLGDSSPVASSAELTNVSFNVEAFELLHGHSRKAEYENCDQCHLEGVIEVAMPAAFADWFYGDRELFETHSGELADCSKCHVGFVPEKTEFAKLSNCSKCHVAGNRILKLDSTSSET